ncbi:MAG: hypothetical protein ACFFKA_14855 [Candidatus Thorarchaeota archaeon]
MRIGKRLSSLFLKFYNVKVKEVVINHNKYLGNKQNSPKIYKGTPSKFFVSPFNMVFDEIDRLLLIDFEGDELYYSLELQIFRIDDNEYPLVILYRKDNLMDIYYVYPKILENREELIKDLLTKGSFNQLDYIDFKFKVDNYGLDCSLSLKDKFERVIEINIREQCIDRELNSMLAPVAAESNKPQYFPIIYLNKFGNMIKHDNIISIKINSEEKHPTEMPVKMNGMHTYLTRYSLNPVICNWNNSYQGELPLIMTNDDSSTFIHNGITYSLFANNAFIEIEKISGEDNKNNKVSFEFSPAIPNLLALRNNIKQNGRFSCCVNNKKGIFAGKYLITTIGNNISLEILPTIGWQPFPGRIWLKTYKWKSEIIIQDDKTINIDSTWKRI